MYDHERYLDTLSRFSRVLLTSYDVDTVLGELTMQVAAVLDLVGSGVSLVRDGQLSYTPAVPRPITELEAVQQRTRSGPCVEALSSGSAVVISDLAGEAARWPRYCEVARREGVRAVAAIPMSLAGERFGSLNLYSGSPREWDPDDLAAARVMADMATGYLINASKLDQQVQLASQLRAALESRVVIEQAKGVVANAEGIGVEEAFDRIRRHARNHQSNLHEVASAVVQLGLRP